ncbi:MAG: outer membrane protein assembly factor BamE [Gammaproteobacteria bacterium]|nr:MAG: outer membrane protein assembly factor BamE [Gammaproteobacteria bacterium]RKZ44908.1 MAG: outer membrane protein assembly factor BamE [Gammaproteobacteria bacterium]RKZ77036.1 MAG: outer membrane protein assembly factor BamE [Gammaproteobacteria bacterium]
MKSKFLIIILGSVTLLSGCAIYKVDVQQGNQITQEMLDQLALKMPAKKVRFIMGTPLLTDVFHQERWDYLYSFQPGSQKRKQRRISLFFDKNQHLTKVTGDIKISKRQSKPVFVPEEFDQEPIL